VRTDRCATIAWRTELTGLRAVVSQRSPFQRRLEWSGQHSPARVQMYGEFDRGSSIGEVGRAIAIALGRNVDGFQVHRLHRDPNRDDPLAVATGVDPAAPVGLFLGFPGEIPPQRVAGHRTAIGCFVCEADRIAPAWVQRCNLYDLIVVPSRYCQRVFRDSGVSRPILVVGHGLDPEFTPRADVERDAQFVFFNAFDYRRAVRKGILELLPAFRKAFDGDPGIRLRLRTYGTSLLHSAIAQHRLSDVVELEQRTRTHLADYAELFLRAHCTVHPSRAEGFGMVPLQSIGCQTPVIAPASTGLTEYLAPDNALLVRNSGPVACDDSPDGWPSGGSYQAVDVEDLVRCLRRMVGGWDEYRAQVARAGPMIRRRWAWEVVLQPLVSLVRGLADADRAGAGEVVEQATRGETVE